MPNVASSVRISLPNPGTFISRWLGDTAEIKTCMAKEKPANKPSSVDSSKDPNAPQRKKDHIELAFQSQILEVDKDNRFFYEPILSGHPGLEPFGSVPFLGKELQVPIWVSSMTGGTELAGTINKNLARACRDFGMGMGLGSCRSLLDSDAYLADFDVRSVMGDNLPLYANLGIAQVAALLAERKEKKIVEMLDKLQADGLIVHVNPMQEWLQPEGDHIQAKPIQVIGALLEKIDRPIIVKEVGQGMGIESLKALLSLPLAAVEFAAFGGTNFALLELLRADPRRRAVYEQLARVGHTASEMVEMVNSLVNSAGETIQCRQLIISGGIQTFLDGYYLIERSMLPSVYGQASAFLKHARGNYDQLHAHVSGQIEGLKVAKAFLRARKD